MIMDKSKSCFFSPTLSHVIHLHTLSCVPALNVLQNTLLELSLDLLTLLVGARLAVESHQSTEVELGRLQQLDLADVNVLQGVDALGGLLDLTANDLGDELRSELRQGAAGSLTLNDVGHLAANGTDLGRSSVCGLLDLVGSALGEADGEKTNEVVISGLDRDVGLDKTLPLADKGAELVRGEVETVEVGQAVIALNFVDAETDLAERVILILLQIGEGNLQDASLQGVVGVLQTGGAVNESLADTVFMLVPSFSCCWFRAKVRSMHSLANVERVRSLFKLLAKRSMICDIQGTNLDRVPVLAGEGVDGLLLEALLALRESLVPLWC